MSDNDEIALTGVLIATGMLLLIIGCITFTSLYEASLRRDVELDKHTKALEAVRLVTEAWQK